MRTPLKGWLKWTVARSNAPSLDAYGVVDEAQQKPVLLMVQGSKCFPLFRFESEKLKSPLFITDAEFFKKLGVHALVIERRGIRSFEPIPDDIAKTDPRLRCSETYGGLTKDARVKDVVDAINALKTESWFGPMMLVGHSEGVDIAAGAARLLDPAMLQSVGLLSGATPSGLYDFAVEARKSGQSDQIKDSIENFFFLTSPDATGKFGGYPIERMKSFTIESDPLSDTLASKAPLFVASGTLDKKASVEAADLFVLEVLRKQPGRIVRYVNFSLLDHDLIDSKEQDHSQSVFTEFVAWSLSPTKKREFDLRAN